MASRVFSILIVMFSVLCLACQDKSNYFMTDVDPNDRIHVIKTEGLDFEYALKLGKEMGISKEANDIVWVRLSIKSQGSNDNPLKALSSNYADYENSIKYFVRDAEKNFHAYNGDGKTLPIVSYNFENTYNLKPTIDIILAIDNKDNTTQVLDISYDDRLYNKGIIKTRYTIKK